jgi:hypothetical protein
VRRKRTWGWEGRHVQKRGEWLWVVAVLGFSVAAMAQTPPLSTAGTKFDGTYAFVSATKVNETYFTTVTNRVGRCGDYRAAPLTIVNGQARIFDFEGTVGPSGELVMRTAPRARSKSFALERIISARIDSNGIIHARRTGYSCRYDLIWQKVSK